MANKSSQSKRCESQTVPKRPVMPRDIFDAAMKGDSDVLMERLGLQTKEQTQIQEDGDSNNESTKDLPFGSELMPLTQRTSSFATKISNDSVQSELQSTTHFGDTVLHLLVTKKHNELSLMVFERDTSLLKTQNKMLETPLHCAAKVGNQEVILRFIDIEPALVKDMLQETNQKGDSALHVAVRCNHAHFCRNLMEFDSELAYTVNKEMFSPFHIAIDEERDFVAKKMLRVDPILACTQLTDGMFPVHLAAHKYNWSMIFYFMTNFPDYAELVDSCGRNLFHLVAELEEKKLQIFQSLAFHSKDLATRMNNATDYDGNTPLHIVAMKGHRDTMFYIWKDMTNCVAETIKNNRGLTPYEVSTKQLEEIWKKDSWRIYSRIHAHELTNGPKFSEEWFMDVMEPPPPSTMENKWERTQVIGLCSVLITTVTFAAAFTIPRGYNQDHGTLVLERRYMFWAFILANTLAFIQGFISLFALLIDALPGIQRLDTLKFASIFFLLAANSMVMAFGLGLYVTFASACLPIAIIVLAVTLLIGSPSLLFALFVYNAKTIWAIYAFSLLFIFCLTLLSLL